MPPLPPGYADVVRAHHAKTTGYLLAMRPPCQRIVDEEVRRVRRRLRAIALAELPKLSREGSWLLGVLLCPGDETVEIASWASGALSGDLDRVRFYLRAGTGAAEALRGWVEAGLSPPLASEVRDFATFHKVFGKHLNDRVWLDHA